MKLPWLRAAVLCACLFTGAAWSALAQGRARAAAPPPPPPPPPSGQHGPGMGGPGAPAAPPPSGGSPGQAGPGSSSSGPGPAGPGNGAPHFGPVGRWWDDRQTVQAIGLNRDQQKKMDSIFNANKPAILTSYSTLEQEKAKLAALEKAPQVDNARVFAQIDAVSKARASLEKATTQMLLQIRRQMDADQIAKLQKLQ